jgi:hypothetical protein
MEGERGAGTAQKSGGDAFCDPLRGREVGASDPGVSRLGALYPRFWSGIPLGWRGWRGTERNAGQVRSLVHIAVDARQGKVFQVLAPAVDPRDDVLDVERGERGIVLMQLAVLATVFGPLPHLGSVLCVRRSGCWAADFPGQAFQDGDEFVGADVAFVFRAFGIGERAIGRLGGQFFDAGLEFGGRSESEHGL